MIRLENLLFKFRLKCVLVFLLCLGRARSTRKRIILLVGENNRAIGGGVAEILLEELSELYDVALVYVGDDHDFDFDQTIPRVLLKWPRLFATNAHLSTLAYSLSCIYKPCCVVAIHGHNLSYLKYFEWAGVTAAVFLSRENGQAVSGVNDLDIFANVSLIISNESYGEDLEEIEREIIGVRDCLVVSEDILRASSMPSVAANPTSLRTEIRSLVHRLQMLLPHVSSARRQEKDGEELIAASGLFDKALALGTSGLRQKDRDALKSYLRASRLASPRKRPGTGRLMRRSMAGFHPLVYASECGTFDDDGYDPLAHYILTGRPDGKWNHKVIMIDTIEAPATPRSAVAIHGHFHYPELFLDFSERLAVNRTRVDLFLTTTDDEKAAQLQKACAQAAIAHFEVKVVPNMGRDIGAFLCAFDDPTWQRYDVIGHFHGKRSLHRDPGFGIGWRTFLWDHLIGSSRPVLDQIVGEFERDPGLGLVFPEDSFLHDWDENRVQAESLARAMGFSQTLPVHFDFPIGNMFWLRPAVLSVLYRLGLSWSDMPPEPLPEDGTILHAIERLLPFAAAEAGLSYATTYSRTHVRD